MGVPLDLRFSGMQSEALGQWDYLREESPGEKSRADVSIQPISVKRERDTFEKSRKVPALGEF